MISKFVTALALFLLLLAVSCSDDDNPVNTVNDDVAPAAITDLVASAPTGNSVVLTWTAPGDDSIAAIAAEYDIRYSTTLITESNWSSANSFGSAPIPAAAGTEQCDTITGLFPTTKYYFAIRTGDEVPNWSGISNIDSMTTYLSGNWTVYTMANSDLPSNTVVDIAFQGATSRYLATLGGLVYVSGTQWTVYTTGSCDIVSDYLSAIEIDAAGIKWIGSSGDGISRFNGTSFFNYDAESTGESIDIVRDIASESEDDIWFATAGYGLYHFDNETWTNFNTSNSDLYSDNTIGCLSYDGAGHLWIGYTMGGVDRYDGASFEHLDADGELASDGVSDIAFAGNSVWFSTEAGVFTFSGSSWTSFTTANSDLASNTVLSLARDLGGDWWFGTSHGLSRYNGSTWVTYNTVNSPLPANQVNSVRVDPVGNVWVGTTGGVGMFYD